MSVVPVLESGKAADVTLLLEGTYPFVSGGVSSWVHQIVSGMPGLRFALVFLGGHPEQYDGLRYELPKNVVHLEQHFLADDVRRLTSRVVAPAGDRDFYREAEVLHEELTAKSCPFASLEKVVARLLEDPARHETDFLFSQSAWDWICRRYEHTSDSKSFLEYFWTVRSMHAPLFAMARIAASLPESRMFHVVSTGYAGLLGMLAHKKRGRPLVLTEHGIYTKERRIELLSASWIQDDAPDGIGFFRQRWIRFFEALARMAYSSAMPIISLYEGNQARQIRDGADPLRTRIVPNGIDLPRFAKLRQRRAHPRVPPKVLGLVGRVVPIKDIKTFIRAMRVLATWMPDVEAWIVGPAEEDRGYAEECRNLVSGLGLERTVKFLGFQKVEEILPKLGLNVLTSISEAQPLVLLEGFAAGVPCVASDVGCVRELVYGKDDEDRLLGEAGIVVDIANPEATARAAMELLSNPARWRAAQASGIARVEATYTEERMLATYRTIYEEAGGL